MDRRISMVVFFCNYSDWVEKPFMITAERLSSLKKDSVSYGKKWARGKPRTIYADPQVVDLCDQGWEGFTD